LLTCLELKGTYGRFWVYEKCSREVTGYLCNSLNDDFDIGLPTFSIRFTNTWVHIEKFNNSNLEKLRDIQVTKSKLMIITSVILWKSPFTRTMISLFMWHGHACPQTHTLSHTYTHTLSFTHTLSLYLSHTHTHTHTNKQTNK
jgi:hypothetical protein